MIDNIVKDNITEDTIHIFITEVLDVLCNGFNVTAENGIDIREECNACEYDWADGEIADLIEEYFGFSMHYNERYEVRRL